MADKNILAWRLCGEFSSSGVTRVGSRFPARRAVWMAMAACAALTCGTGVASAQRSSVNFSQVGTMRTPGTSNVTSSFTQYSYGAGSSSGGNVAGRGGDILSSSLTPNGSFSRGRSSAGGTGATPEDGMQQLGRPQAIRYAQTFNSAITEVSPRSYSITEKTSSSLSPFVSDPVYTGGATRSGNSAAGAGGYSTTVQDMVAGRGDAARNNAKATAKSSMMFSPADVYLDAVGATSILTAERSKPITSLALNDGSRYSICMRQGERYFRSGDYVHAFTEFQLAGITSDHDPSSLLSMAHASFAMSRDSYSLATSYIRQAVRNFPELAQTPLQPRGFFGRPGDYARNLTLLEDYVREKPADTDAQFLLGYFRWFDGDAAAARTALDKAYTSTLDALFQKDIETFWAGMLASGKASGALGVAGSTARVISTSRPATSMPAGPLASQRPAAP